MAAQPASKRTASSECRFLKLPRELRREVYESVADSVPEIKIQNNGKVSRPTAEHALAYPELKQEILSDFQNYIKYRAKAFSHDVYGYDFRQLQAFLSSSVTSVPGVRISNIGAEGTLKKFKRVLTRVRDIEAQFSTGENEALGDIRDIEWHLSGQIERVKNNMVIEFLSSTDGITGAEDPDYLVWRCFGDSI
ncbi:hypothetical protein BAUCODRAFT_146328 [Baudoinia panamericana UAMH 10762]|uniref:Uncharacterized protein n=1 Tax=Baudoinia panamericana (strain UAMH 10762) TaxID=717646 RepID=M2NJ05_BAUPA|nr:uncharacterized protein BAUCODRAFT_146328 [Baudoinia panamericana UAMH 10762]EMC99374.1 hypothetical protein BAUCODRAFT_146328 [Baudoinia panamericana UAMH 10762]